MWAVYCYYDIQSILGDYTHFSSEPSSTSTQSDPIIGVRNLLNPILPYHQTLEL